MSGRLIVALAPDVGAESAGVVRILPMDLPGASATLAASAGPVETSRILPAGLYAVQWIKPSGEIVTQSVRLADGDQRRVVLGAPPPPSGSGRRGSNIFSGRLSPASAMFDRLGDVLKVAPARPQVESLTSAPSMEALATLTAETAAALSTKGLQPGRREGEGWVWTFAPERRDDFWLRVTSGQGVELVRLPLPWADMDGEPVAAAVRLTVRSSPAPGGFVSRIEVDDPAVGGLLPYLGGGALLTAAPLAERVVESLLLGKRVRPLAACAAAYVGLALFTPTEPKTWDAWLANLRAWFPQVADGAILEARRIDLRPSPHERDLIETLLLGAHARGAPIFSAGFELLETLWRSLGQTGASSGVLTTILSVASRLDRGQPFTVIRYPRSAADAS